MASPTVAGSGLGEKLLPRRDEALHRASQNAVVARRLRVLIVDDDDGVRSMVADLLSYAGFIVETAANGKEGLERLERAPPPDAIILDLMMPVVDGWEFRARQLASDAASVPTVIFSASRASVPRSAAGLDGCAHLAKPFDINVLLDVVTECAENGKSRR